MYRKENPHVIVTLGIFRFETGEIFKGNEQKYKGYMISEDAGYTWKEVCI